MKIKNKTRTNNHATKVQFQLNRHAVSKCTKSLKVTFANWSFPYKIKSLRNLLKMETHTSELLKSFIH